MKRTSSFQFPTNEREHLDLVQSLLMTLKGCLLDGSESAWVRASEVIKTLSGNIPAAAYHKIGELWSDAYVNPPQESDLDKKLENILLLVKNLKKK